MTDSEKAQLKNPYKKKAAALKLEMLKTGYSIRGKIKTVSENINLEAESGKLIFLTGQNGAGKTTLIKTICGDLKALSGKISAGGKEISSLKRSELSRLISVVLTAIPDPGYMTVEEIISLGRAPYTGLKNSLSSKDKLIIEKSAAMLSLEKIRSRLFSRLSDGEKQKTMIARALCQDTKIICMDEPGSHLDFPSRIELVSYLKTITENEGKTIIVSSHDLNSALNSSDIMWLIDKQGQIHTGAPEDLALSGMIAEVFNRGNFRFSEQTGEFLSDKVFKKSVKAEGPAEALFWTGKALRRTGIKTVYDDGLSEKNKLISGKLTVRSSGKSYIWNYRGEDFFSIDEVVRFIKEQ